LLGQDYSSEASLVFVLWCTDLAVFVPIASDGGAREGVVLVSDGKVAYRVRTTMERVVIVRKNFRGWCKMGT
jgi:hypothetical protein